MSILFHQVSCSVILTAALSDLFPDARIMNFQATEKCFFCDFTLPFPFEKEMLPLLEDRMRAWVKKNLPFQQMEMVPMNAAEFLEHQGNSFEAAKVRAETDLVQLIRLDHFVGRSPGIPLQFTGEIKFFKLVSAKSHGNWIRLIGSAAFSKDELKTRVEKCKKIGSHLLLIEKLQLFQPCPQGWIWLPRGESLKKSLIQKAHQQFSTVDSITTPACDEQTLLMCHSAYVKATGRASWEMAKIPLGRKGYELFNTTIGAADRLFFAAEEQTIISFLQIIAKFLSIFTFDFEVVIVGKTSKLLREALKKMALKTSSERGEHSCIEFRLHDALGRSWAGPRMWHIEKEKIAVISLFYSLERFVALLLEKMDLETLIGRLKEFESQ